RGRRHVPGGGERCSVGRPARGGGAVREQARGVEIGDREPAPAVDPHDEHAAAPIGRPDPALLIAGCDAHGIPVRHPCRARDGCRERDRSHDEREAGEVGDRATHGFLLGAVEPGMRLPRPGTGVCARGRTGHNGEIAAPGHNGCMSRETIARPRDHPPPRSLAMLSYSRSHLADHVLLRTLAAIVTQDRVTTAEMLALIAEVDRRGSFRGEGFSSMYRYCVEKLRMSEDVACKRILTARAARRFPAILPAIADGRLAISTVALLSTHLKTKHAEALLMDAVDKTRAEVELLIAARFPKEDVPTTLIPVAAAAAIPAVAPTQSDVPNSASPPQSAPEVVANAEALSAPGRITPPSPSQDPPSPASPAPQRRVAPLSPGRFELRLTISQQLHDKLRRAQELLSHSVPDGDIPQLLERALDELITKQERLKFAATDKPRAVRGSASNSRHIPAAVKRKIRL